MTKLTSPESDVLRSIFEELDLGIAAIDRTGTVLFSNPAAANIIGFEHEQVSLEDWLRYYGFFLPDGVTQYASDESPLVKALAGEEQSNIEVLVQNQLGSAPSRWCTLDLRSLRNDEGEIWAVLLLIRDTTERRRLSDEAARSNAALQQFATVAAHDLQEPLRSIGGFADMLAQHQGDHLDKESARCMMKIKDGLSRMQALINDLLNFSRIQTKPQVLSPVNCNEILAICTRSLNASITEKAATISTDSLPTVMADALQLSQLFQNIVGNAIKFSEGRAPVIHVSAKRLATSWQFSIADNGIGIAPEFTDRVFRVFQRLHTKSAYSGTGIGLAICQTIVDRHGGRIWVESQPGEGSTFHFTIPASGALT